MVISGGQFRPDALKPKEVVSLLLDDAEMETKCKVQSQCCCGNLLIYNVITVLQRQAEQEQMRKKRRRKPVGSQQVSLH